MSSVEIPEEYPETLGADVEALAREVGDMLNEALGKTWTEEAKASEIDIVTEMDRKSEELLLAGLGKLFPAANVLSEETGEVIRPDSSGAPLETPWRWCVDPIDGTTNFAHGNPVFTISIALEHASVGVVLGLVYHPPTGEAFSAELGKGAFCNGKPIHVSSVDSLVKAVVSTGFPTDRAVNSENNLANFARVALQVRGVRRIGSAALDLAYVASGRQDAYWEYRLSTWDIAAGVLLVREAGGKVNYMDGGEVDLSVLKHSPCASNGLVHDRMLQELDLGMKATPITLDTVTPKE